jgi:hypothetical protein
VGPVANGPRCVVEWVWVLGSRLIGNRCIERSSMSSRKPFECVDDVAGAARAPRCRGEPSELVDDVAGDAGRVTDVGECDVLHIRAGNALDVARGHLAELVDEAVGLAVVAAV